MKCLSIAESLVLISARRRSEDTNGLTTIVGKTMNCYGNLGSKFSYRDHILMVKVKLFSEEIVKNHTELIECLHN
jgi:hypothetical protein